MQKIWLLAAAVLLAGCAKDGGEPAPTGEPGTPATVEGLTIAADWLLPSQRLLAHAQSDAPVFWRCERLGDAVRLGPEDERAILIELPAHFQSATELAVASFDAPTELPCPTQSRESNRMVAMRFAQTGVYRVSASPDSNATAGFAAVVFVTDFVPPAHDSAHFEGELMAVGVPGSSPNVRHHQLEIQTEIGNGTFDVTAATNGPPAKVCILLPSHTEFNCEARIELAAGSLAPGSGNLTVELQSGVNAEYEIRGTWTYQSNPFHHYRLG